MIILTVDCLSCSSNSPLSIKSSIAIKVSLGDGKRIAGNARELSWQNRNSSPKNPFLSTKRHFVVKKHPFLIKDGFNAASLSLIRSQSALFQHQRRFREWLVLLQ
jgi:hypothetical protein